MYFSFVFLLISILSLIYSVNSYGDTGLDDDFPNNYNTQHFNYNEKYHPIEHNAIFPERSDFDDDDDDDDDDDKKKKKSKKDKPKKDKPKKDKPKKDKPKKDKPENVGTKKINKSPKKVSTQSSGSPTDLTTYKGTKVESEGAVDTNKIIYKPKTEEKEIPKQGIRDLRFEYTEEELKQTTDKSASQTKQIDKSASQMEENQNINNDTRLFCEYSTFMCK